MVRITHDFRLMTSVSRLRLLVEVICSLLLYCLVVIPMAVAAFTVSVYMGVPFVCVLALGWVKRFKHNT